MTNIQDKTVNHPDVIIIGSGFGGSVMASRLADAGKSVIVLERGPWRDTTAVRSAGIKDRKPLPRDSGMLSVLRSIRPPIGPKKGIRLNKNGYLEMWIGDGIKSPCTSNVGGGSHIWAALMDRAPKGFWDKRASGISDEIISPHYDRALQELKAIQPSDPSTIPNHTDHAWDKERGLAPLGEGEQPPMGILFPESSDKLSPVTDTHGITREPIDLNKDNGMFGSPGASKSTVDALFLLPALKHDLVIRDLHEVQTISSKKTGGYEVTVRDLRRGKTETLLAPVVVVSAGTMNTNALLLSSRDEGGLSGMPALGMGLGANGDLISKWPAKDRDAAIGPPSFGRVKVSGHEDSAYIILAAGETPPVPGFLRKGARKKAGQCVDVVAMSQDAADGRIWSENGRIRFAFDLKGSPSYAATMKAMDALSEASGRKVTYPDKEVFTAHPMGGCRISDKPDQGVVDGNGEVHGHKGLYIADASVFPQPVGVPPSLSIAAWSSHVAEQILKRN